MGSAYGISDCLGWYLAGVGTFSDAGVTPAQPGQAVAQWDDQSGAGNHLVQPTPANRPILQPCGHPAGVGFNSAAATSLDFPTSLIFPAGAATVLLCTRGTAGGILSFGSVGYGTAGANGLVAATATGGTVHSGGIFLPRWHPCVHGIVVDATAATLWINTSQNVPTSPLALSPTAQGVLGYALDASAGWTGEVLELLIFDRALTPAEVQSALVALQNSNALASTADSNLLLLVGDEQVAGGPGAPRWQAFPYWLDRSDSGTFSSLQTATAGETCASQQATLQALIPALSLSGFSKRLAVIACGINDVLIDGCTAEQVIDRFTAVVQTIRSLPAVGVVAAVPLLQAGSAGVSASQQSAIDTFRQWLRTGASGVVDVVVDWTADARLSDTAASPVFRSGAVLTAETGARVAAALVKSAIDGPPGTIASPVVGGDYGIFYGASRSFTGAFGAFVRA